MKNFEKEYGEISYNARLVAHDAKKYIVANWEKVKDWSKLSILMRNGNTESNTNKKEKEFYLPYALSFGNHKREANPILDVTKISLDDIDGDFSITINNELWLWIPDKCVVVLADYVEKQLNEQKKHWWTLRKQEK